MIEKKTRYVDEVLVRRYIEENHRKDIKDLSGEEAISFLFGDLHERGDFVVVNRYWEPEEKWYHRLNRVWAFPLTLLCAPYQYIIHGQVGWSDKSKFGSWILRAVGCR